MDVNKDEYLDFNEFLNGFIKIYISTFIEKFQVVFDIYDFDGDGFINKDDISTILSHMPMV